MNIIHVLQDEIIAMHVHNYTQVPNSHVFKKIVPPLATYVFYNQLKKIEQNISLSFSYLPIFKIGCLR